MGWPIYVSTVKKYKMILKFKKYKSSLQWKLRSWFLLQFQKIQNMWKPKMYKFLCLTFLSTTSRSVVFQLSKSLKALCVETVCRKSTEMYSWKQSNEFLTLKTKVSLNTGFKVFLWTLVSNFFFLSGRRYTLTYGSDVPPISKAGRSSACITVTEKLFWLKSYSSWNKITYLEYVNTTIK